MSNDSKGRWAQRFLVRCLTLGTDRGQAQKTRNEQQRLLQTGVFLLLLLLHNGLLFRKKHPVLLKIKPSQCVCVSVCASVSDPDVVDDGSSFALCSLWVSYQVVPGAEHPPAEREVLIRGTGQAQARVLGHSARELLSIQTRQYYHRHIFITKYICNFGNVLFFLKIFFGHPMIHQSVSF